MPMSDEATPIGAREIIALSKRGEARRRSGDVPPMIWVLAAGSALFGIIAYHLGVFSGAAADMPKASTMWCAAVGIGHVLVFLLAPQRAFWRPDSQMLARLPIPGQVLFQLSLSRAIHSTVRVAVPCGIALAAFALWGTWSLFLRHGLLLLVAGLAAAIVAPAVTLLAGATVASERAQALVDSIGGEFQAPKHTWLGALPGIAAAVLILTLVAGHRWAGDTAPSTIGWWIAGFGLSLPIVSLLWSFSNANRIMPAALREVAALDQERLAHVDRSQPSRLARRLAGGSPGGRLVFLKDATLLRRRFPVAYLLWFVCVISLWIAAIAGATLSSGWTIAIVALFLLHAIATTPRILATPTEVVRYLHTLPIPVRDWTASKRRYVHARLVSFFIVGLSPLLVRDLHLESAVVLAALLVFSLLATTYSLRRSS